jgi:hypothetical protein
MSALSHLSLSRRVAGGAAALLIAGAVAVTPVAGPAWASGISRASGSASASATDVAPGDNLATAKGKVDSRIDKAVARIDKATAGLGKANGLSAADKTTLTTKLAALRQQLVAAKATADTAPDGATLRSDVKDTLATLKAGEAPVVRAAVGAARVEALVDAVSGRLPTIEARVNAAKARGLDVSAAQAALTDLQAKLADAHTKVTGLAAAVISGKTSPADAKTALGLARGDLKAARADVKTLRNWVPG